jgi:hypothetical protein
MSVNNGSLSFTANGIAIGGNTANVALDVGGANDAIAIPSGFTSDRPPGQPGFFRYNRNLSSFEGFTTAWETIGTSTITVQNATSLINVTSVLEFSNSSNVLMNITDDFANSRVNVHFDIIGVPITAGGANTQIQFNLGGALAGNPGLTFNQASNTVTANTIGMTGALGITYANPQIFLTSSTAPANGGQWSIVARSNGTFSVLAENDSGSNVNPIYNASRTSGTANVTVITYGNSLDFPQHTINGSVFLQGPTPVFYQKGVNANANTGLWNQYVSGNAGTLVFESRNDSQSNVNQWMTVNRANGTSNVTQIQMGTPRDFPNIILTGNVFGSNMNASSFVSVGSNLPVGPSFINAYFVGGQPPYIYMQNQAVAANTGLWNMRVDSSGEFIIEARSDNTANINQLFLAARNSGTSNITGVTYGNALDNPQHTFDGNVAVSNIAINGNVTGLSVFTGSLLNSVVNPGISMSQSGGKSTFRIVDTTAATNAKAWQWTTSGPNMFMQTVSDDWISNFNSYLQVNRVAVNVAAITIGNLNDLPTIALDGASTITTNAQFKGLTVANPQNQIGFIVGNSANNDNGQMGLKNANIINVSFIASGSSFLLGGALGIGTPTPNNKLHVVGAILSEGASYLFSQTAAAANTGKWQQTVDTSGTFRIVATNDNQSNLNNILQATRSNTTSNVTSIQYGNSIDNPGHSFFGVMSVQSVAAQVIQQPSATPANTGLYTHFVNSTGQWALQARNDAQTNVSNILVASRANGTSNVTTIAYGNPNDLPLHQFSGNVTVSGPSSLNAAVTNTGTLSVTSTNALNSANVGGLVNRNGRTYFGKDGANNHWFATLDNGGAEPGALAYTFVSNGTSIISHTWMINGLGAQQMNYAVGGGFPQLLVPGVVKANQFLTNTNIDVFATAVSAANTVATFANGTLVLANANLNFNNTATVNISVTANGTTQTNVAFSVNASSVAGGSNTQIQFNNNGALAGSANLTFNLTSNNVTLGSGPPISGDKLAVVRTGGSASSGEVLASDGTHWTQFNSNSSAGAFNPIVQANDHAIIFTDTGVGTGNIVIAPWSTPGAGLRMDSNGNVNVTGLLFTTNSTLLGIPALNAAVATINTSFLPLAGGTMSGTLIGAAITATTMNASSTLNVVTSIVTAGTIVAGGNITAGSDRKLKKNIARIRDALDIVNSMRGVYFTRRSDAANKRQVGVIAQEIQAVLPEVVEGTDTLSVNYGAIVGVLIEAIKEQQKQINELKKPWWKRLFK